MVSTNQSCSLFKLSEANSKYHIDIAIAGVLSTLGLLATLSLGLTGISTKLSIPQPIVITAALTGGTLLFLNLRNLTQNYSKAKKTGIGISVLVFLAYIISCLTLASLVLKGRVSLISLNWMILGPWGFVALVGIGGIIGSGVAKCLIGPNLGPY